MLSNDEEHRRLFNDKILVSPHQDDSSGIDPSRKTSEKFDEFDDEDFDMLLKYTAGGAGGTVEDSRRAGTTGPDGVSKIDHGDEDQHELDTILTPYRTNNIRTDDLTQGLNNADRRQRL